VAGDELPQRQVDGLPLGSGAEKVLCLREHAVSTSREVSHAPCTMQGGCAEMHAHDPCRPPFPSTGQGLGGAPRVREGVVDLPARVRISSRRRRVAMSQAPVVAPTPTVIDRLRNVPSPVLVAASSFGLLMAVAGRYGRHRDELYFFEAGRHLAWGYVDFPPAVAAIGRVAECRQRRRRKPRVGMHRSATSLGSTVARPQRLPGLMGVESDRRHWSSSQVRDAFGSPECE